MKTVKIAFNPMGHGVQDREGASMQEDHRPGVSTITVHDIMEARLIRTLYQPIVRLEDSAIIGYEALSRGPQGTPFEGPLALLAEAERQHRLWEFEILLRRLALERAVGLERGQTLFLNVDPRIIHDPDFQQGLTREYLSRLDMSPASIVFEITERHAIRDQSAFERALANYRDQGYHIAIDDAGSGYSGMHTIAISQPSYVKIDMDIVRGVNGDPLRQAIIKSFVTLGQMANIRIIAEGIETREELKTLVRLGVYAGQGYYLQRPVPGIQGLHPEKAEEIRTISHIQQNQSGYSSQYHYIGNLATEQPVIHPDIPCSELEALFRRDEQEAYCLTEEGAVSGLVTRRELFQAMSGQHGYAVYSRRPAALVMNRQPMVVDYYTPVSVVADMAMKRCADRMYDPVIVTRGSSYFGMTAVRDLLRYAVEYERDYARELNPLTQLPGNKVINRVLNDILVYSTQAALFYFDLDYFKAYNDIYGFEKGDQVICMVSRIIQQVIKGRDAINTFVGHIGGDDFVALVDSTEPSVLHQLCREILDHFEAEIRPFYTETHWRQGYIDAEDRQGNPVRHSLSSLSIGVLYGELTRIPDVGVLGEYMAAIKKGVKKIPGNAYQLMTVEIFEKMDERLAI